MAKGKVYLVGAGPGDVGLLTIKGKEVIESADVVIYDALVGHGVLALIPKSAQLIYVGKRAGNHAVKQEDINKIILEKALEGKTVARLKGGDPFMFGRGGEELELLVKENIPYEIVCGVTSAIAAPAYGGIPVTHRDYASSLHIITGHTKAGEGSTIDFDALVRLDGTLVFLMGITSIRLICEGLKNAKMSGEMPCAIIQEGTRGVQRKLISTLDNLEKDAVEKGIKAPAVIIVGRVCKLGEQFEWFEKMPLFGKRIVVTRPKELNSTFIKELRSLGADVIELPTICTREIEGLEFFDNINDCTAFAFTSIIGVKTFFKKLVESGRDIRDYAGVEFYAVGKMTKREIEKMGVRVSLTPEIYSGEALGKEISGGKIAILRAKEGASGLTEELAKKNIPFIDIPLYETYYETPLPEVIAEIERGVDYIAFTSASTVTGFVNCVKTLNISEYTALCIGEQTAQKARECGFKVKIAKEATTSSMVDFIRGEVV